MKGLDPTIHPLPRLSVCALLAAGADWVEFRTVREATGLSDSMFSKHSRTLEDAGYLEVRKGAEGRRPRTWFRLTDRGLDAYRRHVDALRRMTQDPGRPETRSSGNRRPPVGRPADIEAASRSDPALQEHRTHRTAKSTAPDWPRS